MQVNPPAIDFAIPNPESTSDKLSKMDQVLCVEMCPIWLPNVATTEQARWRAERGWRLANLVAKCGYHPPKADGMPSWQMACEVRG